MRTKTITFLLLSILIPPMGNSLYSQEEKDAIKFHLQSGETKQFSLGEVKNLTFSKKSLSITFIPEKEKEQFELDQLLKITFEDSGIYNHQIKMFPNSNQNVLFYISSLKTKCTFLKFFFLKSHHFL